MIKIKGNLRAILLPCLALIWITFPSSLLAKSEMPVEDISLVCEGTVGIEGTWLAKIAVIMEKPGINVEANLKKAALKGVMMSGIGASAGCSGQKPLVKDSDVFTNHSEFFETLYADPNLISRFVKIVSGSLRSEKIKKKYYRVCGVVIIQKDDLRKYLEQNKIIEGFSDLF